MWTKISKFVPKILVNSGKQLRVGTFMFTRNASTNVEERKVNVKGVDINYVKTGTGAHPVLLLPGVLGSAWSDFKPQIDNLDKSRMTIVAWDPPGQGKSRPPDRTYPSNFFERDADFAHDLMKILGFDTFSLLGWSDGGITSFLLAANYPKSVRKMVTWGANSYILPTELKGYENIRDIDKWSERMKAPLIEMYGNDYFQKTWSAWIDCMTDIFKSKNGDICKECIPRIKCPTLLIHGAKDAIVDREHAEFLQNEISGSQFKVFEKGAHNLHLRYPEEFNELVTKFLLE